MMSVRSTALLGAALIGASGCSTLAEPLDPIEREKVSIAKVALPAPGRGLGSAAKRAHAGAWRALRSALTPGPGERSEAC